MPIGRLHVITDTRPGRDPLAIVAAAIEAGAPVVQVRGKELSDRELYDLTCRVLELCVHGGATCLVDDRLHVAVAAGAGGAHVGEHDLPVAAARRVLGNELVLGATARAPETALAHQRDGATYLGVGPCYPTATKSGLPALLGPAGVAQVAVAVDVPVIAIAGVTAPRIPELLAAGAFGVAVIGAISTADDPHAATEELLRALEKAP
ncbi:MAG TPA: thiamine phosphate synthase [Acidimicrobiia bacterium]